MLITGQKIDRPKKELVAAHIADALSLPRPYTSEGSSVDSVFLDEIHSKLFGRPSGGADTYRKTEALLERLGLTYDPVWDASEAAPKGGGTVTTRAYSRILVEVTQTPRCFLINTGHTVALDKIYRYDAHRSPLTDAGPGSKAIFHDGRRFFGAGTVVYIGPDWKGPFWAELGAYQAFSQPVSRADLRISGWTKVDGIEEVTPATYQALLHAGGVTDDPMDAVRDIGGGQVVRRLMKEHPVESLRVRLRVPASLPIGELVATPLIEPAYAENEEGEVRVTEPLSQIPPDRDPVSDRLAERRAVELATRALEADGWRMTRDRQKDGCGYDLEFSKDSRLLKVEVKGIQGSNLTFNLTPKELWRAESDADWVVVAVTSVLSPSEPTTHLLTRDRVLAASRVVTGYRLRL